MRKQKLKNISFLDVLKRFEDISLPQSDLVVGIARGGVVPACLAAQRIMCDARFIHIHFRADDHSPEYQRPKLLAGIKLLKKHKRVLLVDDVSMTGKTLDCAMSLFPRGAVQTLVLRGKADYVLFPELRECVRWPWNAYAEQMRSRI